MSDAYGSEPLQNSSLGSVVRYAKNMSPEFLPCFLKHICQM